MTPPVSETAAWTEQDEHEMLRYGVGTIPPSRTTGAHQDNAVRFAREIRRLRAEREQTASDYVDACEEVSRLRADNERLKQEPQNAQQIYDLLLAKKLEWFEEAAKVDLERHRAAPDEDLVACLRELRHFAPAATHWGINIAIDRIASLRSELAAASRERETPPQSNNHTQETGL